MGKKSIRGYGVRTESHIYPYTKRPRVNLHVPVIVDVYDITLIRLDFFWKDLN